MLKEREQPLVILHHQYTHIVIHVPYNLISPQRRIDLANADKDIQLSRWLQIGAYARHSFSSDYEFCAYFRICRIYKLPLTPCVTE